MPRQLKSAIELVSDIGNKAFDLQHHPEADIIKAVVLLRHVNAPMFDWLTQKLLAGTMVEAEPMNELSLRTLVRAMEDEAHSLERTGYAPLATRVRRWAKLLADAMTDSEFSTGHAGDARCTCVVRLSLHEPSCPLAPRKSPEPLK